MLIKIKRGWEISESHATSERVFSDRRAILKGLGFGTLLAVSGDFAMSGARGAAEDPSAGLYPVKRNERYTLDRPLTDEKISTTYNNFYEFGSQKEVFDEAQALKIRPWMVTIDGMVEAPITIDIDSLLKKMPLEERLYRHRCVEAWSFTEIGRAHV